MRCDTQVPHERLAQRPLCREPHAAAYGLELQVTVLQRSARRFQPRPLDRDHRTGTDLLAKSPAKFSLAHDRAQGEFGKLQRLREVREDQSRNVLTARMNRILAGEMNAELRLAAGPLQIEIRDASAPGGVAALFGFVGVPAEARTIIPLSGRCGRCR